MGRTSDAKERLLQSATDLMLDQGFGAVGVSELCNHAGVKKGSFYHFFESKQALALEMVESLRREHNERNESVLIGPEPPLERLGVFLDGVYAYHSESCAATGKMLGCPIGNLALEMSTRDQVMRLRLLQVLEGQMSLIEEVLREARKSGDWPGEMRPRDGAEMVMSLIEGKVMLAKLRDDAEPLKDLRQLTFLSLGLDPAEATAA